MKSTFLTIERPYNSNMEGQNFDYYISIPGGRGGLRQVSSTRETGPEESAAATGDDEVRPGSQSGLHLSPLHLQQ